MSQFDYLFCFFVAFLFPSVFLSIFFVFILLPFFLRCPFRPFCRLFPLFLVSLSTSFLFLRLPFLPFTCTARSATGCRIGNSPTATHPVPRWDKGWTLQPLQSNKLRPRQTRQRHWRRSRCRPTIQSSTQCHSKFMIRFRLKLLQKLESYAYHTVHNVTFMQYSVW